MSVQFGIWNFEGLPAAPDYIEKVRAALAPYGPDSNELYSGGGIDILYRAFHTTKESHREKQPYISSSGAVIAWDGRLDNRANLISDLGDSLTIASTDVAFVAAAYEKWGADCLGKLIGDWALSIWNPRERCVLLAKDHIGTRHLFYSMENNQVTWSTILDPLVLLAGKTFEICEEYIADWLTIRFPSAHLTPYVGIHSVPPSCSVQLQSGKHGTKHIITKYWDFDPGKRIRHHTDAEYEEHFRTSFAVAVQRRLRSDAPVLAELSGGMDSSSIVCIADMVLAQSQHNGTATSHANTATPHLNIAPIADLTPRLDTISWYYDFDPALDERPYFAKIEEKRGHIGCHIDAGFLSLKEKQTQKRFGCEFESNRFAATPDSNRRLDEHFKQYVLHMESLGHRVTLSGLGGEEATGGGVPTPIPELRDLLARARFFTLARQLRAWATKMRRHPLPLLWEAVRGFLPLGFAGTHRDINLGPWFHPGFIRHNRAAFRRHSSNVKLLGPLASFQEHVGGLDVGRRILAYCGVHSELLRDIRYPYFDRDLLEFVFAIPREQLVRVGQRRSLMKRALVGIVPDELLNRRKIAPIEQNRPNDISTKWPSPSEIARHIVSSFIEIVDPDRFLEALRKARRNEEFFVENLQRTLTLEGWLRHLTMRGVLTDSLSTRRQKHSSSLEANDLQEPTQPKSLAS